MKLVIITLIGATLFAAAFELLKYANFVSPECRAKCYPYRVYKDNPCSCDMTIRLAE